MDDREKLIELIEQGRYELQLCNSKGEVIVLPAPMVDEEIVDILADHLIANNVVIQKQGEWIDVNEARSGICSNCHRLDYIDPLATHCRYCGAKMRGVK